MDIDDVETVAVLGAGNMGHGIAEVAALAGYDVALRDVEEEFVQQGYDDVEWSLEKLVEQEQIDEAEAAAALERVTPLVDLAAAVGDADVVIEAVPEKMDVKRDVYGEVEQYAPERAIFATNTSSLSITDIAAATDRPGQFCGMHFFNPPVRMQLVEVIAGDETDEATLETVEALAESMDKTPVRVRTDSPGFIVNRVLVPLLNEAAWLVHDDEATIEAVDSTVKYDVGLPMGPFELADRIGIDVACDVLEYMHAELGDAYEPCPLLLETVEAGDLGEKTGRGFYDHDGGVSVPADAGREEIGDRLVAVAANEVAKLVAGDVADPEEIDEAVTLGAGFPRGPARMADEHGLASLHDTLATRHEGTGAARYEPASDLAERASAGRGFHADGDDTAETGLAFDGLAVSVRDGVGHLELDRQHRMNTIDESLLRELGEAVDALAAEEDVRAILLTGAGDRAFSAGADVQSMAGSAQPRDAVELSRLGQHTFQKLETCDVPVVAGIDGYCLGGGMELATCADLRIASERSELGQPEHELGLLPAWGGTQRLANLVGEGRAKEIIFTADRYEPATLADYGFLNEVVAVEDFEERAWDLARDLASGPPIAQTYTKRAMHADRESEEAGLELEAQAFGHLMGTEDLMEGVAAFMSDRDPEFEGK